MKCPVCGEPTAPNAFPGDPRCGPCCNFRITAIDGYAAILRVDFEQWIQGIEERLRAANNVGTYATWLEALRRAQARKSSAG